MDQESVDLILGQYERNGWNLRRVLITPEMAKEFSGLSGLSGAMNTAAEIDALWFSRARTDGRVAWEIRHLSDTPYALVEVLEPSITDDELELILSAAELRLKEIMARKMGI